MREVEGAVEIYIRCRMCREETVLERHPAAQLEFIQRRMRRRRTALSRRPPR